MSIQELVGSQLRYPFVGGALRLLPCRNSRLSGVAQEFPIHQWTITPSCMYMASLSPRTIHRATSRLPYIRLFHHSSFKGAHVPYLFVGAASITTQRNIKFKTSRYPRISCKPTRFVIPLRCNDFPREKKKLCSPGRKAVVVHQSFSRNKNKDTWAPWQNAVGSGGWDIFIWITISSYFYIACISRSNPGC